MVTGLRFTITQIEELQKKSKYNSDIQSQHTKLSIQLSLDGFSFCISDVKQTDIAVFTEYSFDVSIPTPELLLGRIQQIFNQDEDLHHDFKEVLVVHQNNLSTLVPDTFFDETKLNSYLNYTVKTLTNDYITYDNLKLIQAKNVYIPYVNVNNYLFQNFGEFEFNHHSTILIDKLLTYSQNQTEKIFFINVHNKTIDIVVTNGKQLVFYNSFEVTTKEDFIYYILFVAEQLQMNPNEFQLLFLGNINANTTYYDIAYEYVRNINFIEPSIDFFNNSDDFTPHSNYILIS